MSKPLTDQLRAYFADVDRQQGTVDIDALRRSVEDGAVMIELSPDEVVRPNGPISSRRWPILISAAAAVVAIAFVASRDDEATPADQPTPTVTVTTTTPPRAMVARGGGPGTYFVDYVRGTPTPRIFVTVGAGWDGIGLEELVFYNSEIGWLDIGLVDAVFSDACHPSDGFHPGPVDTVDGLIAALREQQGGWTDVTATSDFSIDGYTGKAFQRSAPTEFSGCEAGSGGTRLAPGLATYPVFASWRGEGWGADYYYEPGQTETLWVLDIEGTVVVIGAQVWPGPSWAARADVAAAVLDSIRIDRPSSPEPAASGPNLSTPPMLPVAGREWGVGALAPDLGRFTDEAAVLDALAASGPLTNQSLSDPNVHPGVSICADIVRFHEPEVGTLVHEATAVLDGQVGVVLVFKQPGNLTQVRMYGTGEADAGTGSCPLLMKTSLHPGPADNALLDD